MRTAAFLLLFVLAAPGSASAKDPGAPALGAPRVAGLVGAAARGGKAARAGDTLPPGERLRVAEDPEARLELRFAEGSLLRLGPGADVSVVSGERRVLLRGGRLLVQADRMIGGVAVWTPWAALEPLGTTYVVEVDPDGGVYVLVLEGALQLLRPPLPPEWVLLSGEALRLPPKGPPGSTGVRSLLEALEDEPLLRAFPAPLPTLARLRDLGDQQRRGVLAGRNERLRRELNWRRPPRQPIVLPELFR
jgi:ferric-dicitrate binding protein FerR (iron transport regulator)